MATLDILKQRPDLMNVLIQLTNVFGAALVAEIPPTPPGAAAAAGGADGVGGAAGV